MNRESPTSGPGSGRAKIYRRVRSDALVDRVVPRQGVDARAILPALQQVAATRHTLDPECLGALADATGVHDARVAGVASFYSMLPEEAETGVAIRVCDGPVCMLHGACDVRTALDAAVDQDHQWRVDRTSCLGLCDRAPAVLVGTEPCGPVDHRRIECVLGGWRGPTPTYGDAIVGEQRVAMRRIGRIDAKSYASARAAGAYEAVEHALSKSAQMVLHEVEESGLRGCGGAGFPTGRKWRMVQAIPSPEKYVICNGDESEPGASKDRTLMEGDPHQVLEGMALAAYAVGAKQGIIYVRGEYEQSARALEGAIQQARDAGWLGENIADSPFSFDVHVHRGAGAYICGEETALLESLEGHRGEPRLRPPYPTSHGYLRQPTVVNNVETLCMVPAIVRYGGNWYHGLGTAGSPGTKLFTLTGHVRRPRVFESTLGITVRDMLDRIGLGMRSGSVFKMALTGGAAGTFVPPAFLDVPVDFESIRQGVALGSGVVIVFDTSVSAVDVLAWLLRFFRYEACGKCTPCREGTHVASTIAERIARGEGRSGDIADLRRFASMLDATSLCGLGRSVALPIHSALDHFAADFQKCGAT